MRDLPTGTVTLLFTDIEGSTRLLDELGKRYADVLAEHRRLLREAFRAHGGVEVDTQGDAFFYAFVSARAALTAAGEAQAALEQGSVRVRMGVHTGEPIVTAEGYVGADLHRAARIAAAGHGGQVLVSASTAALVDLDLRDMGAHRLKDLTAAERLYQLGDIDFPPLRTLDAAALPVAAGALIGRDREVSELVSLLRDSQRLVTVTGPGGTGKTRLALQVAAELVGSYSEGVFWVPLAGVGDSRLLLPAMSQALGARVALAQYVRERDVLLVLDTVEHLLAAASDLAELLGAAPRLRLLVTSRVPLHVSAEYEYPVDPLPATSAGTLFVERARAVGRELELDDTVTEICARLDNLPLALELAAARTKLLDPVSLLSRLERRLPLLVGGPRDVPERQRTLEAAIAWSYDLLDEDAKTLFRRLAVFAGGFSLEAAEAVGGSDLDVLTRLVEASLLKSVGDGRLLMLDTIREYALERLEETGEGPELRDRHAAHFAQLADGRWLQLIRGEAEWMATVSAELRNLHAAIDWSLGQHRTEDALAIATGIWPFWNSRGYIREGRRWLEQALGPPSQSAERRGLALAGLGDLALFEGDRDAARRAHEEALAIFRDLDRPQMVAAALAQLSDIALDERDLGTARNLAEESVAIRRADASLRLARGLIALAEVYIAEGDYVEARQLIEEAIEHESIEAPASDHLMGSYEALGEVLRRQGDDMGALHAFAESIHVGERRGEQWPEVLEGIAAIWSLRGDAERAARTAGAAERLREQLGFTRFRPDRPLPDRVEPAWSEGRAMSTEEAVEYALRHIE